MRRSGSRPLAALAAAALASCATRAEKASLPPAAAAPRAVRVARPSARLETSLARATGTVRARDEATLSARATGQVKRIAADVGARVRAGAAVVELDHTNAEIGVENARAMERLAAAALAEAERDLARSKVLHDEGSLPPAAFEKAQTGREMAAARRDQARAALRAAEQALADTTLTAPFAGVVTARFHSAGDTVTLMPVTPILVVTDVDRLEARLAVPEVVEPWVKVGQVVAGASTPAGRRFEARVRVKNAVVDPATRTVEVLADLVRVEGPPLRPGTLVTVDFSDFGEKGGLFLPATALRAGPEGTWVLLAVGGRAERRDVVAAQVSPGTVSIRSGLSASDAVVLDPGALSPGEAVVALAEEAPPRKGQP